MIWKEISAWLPNHLLSGKENKVAENNLEAVYHKLDKLYRFINICQRFYLVAEWINMIRTQCNEKLFLVPV